jgi:choloylglycine hydrolase
MKKWLIALISLQLVSSTYACTDFQLKAKDGSLLITRSMEFGMDVNSNLRTSPRGRSFTTALQNNKAGMAWISKYGYVYVDGFGQDISLDGMNENGLTFEYLYLPGETQYQAVPAGKENQAISYTQFGDWILGNFKSIDEVRTALQTIYVAPTLMSGLGNIILPGHAAIYDASGKGIVVEFYDNKINVSDSVGVMTNSPKYNWHVTNLRNYLNLSPNNPDPISVDGMTFSATGQGAGMVGLPGDVSPPSRFVKTAFMLKNVYPANNAADLLNLSQHIINNVDIPAGLARTTDNGKISTDTTQWVVFKDMTNKMMHYRTYNDMTIRTVNFNKLNFAENAPRLKMPLIQAPFVVDMTDRFLNVK